MTHLAPNGGLQAELWETVNYSIQTEVVEKQEIKLEMWAREDHGEPQRSYKELGMSSPGYSESSRGLQQQKNSIGKQKGLEGTENGGRHSYRGPPVMAHGAVMMT